MQRETQKLCIASMCFLEKGQPKCYIRAMSINAHILKGDSIFTSFRSINGLVVGLCDHKARVLSQINESYFQKRFDTKYLEDYFLKDLSEYIEQHPNHYIRVTFYPSSKDLRLGVVDLEVLFSSSVIPVKTKELKLKQMSSPYSKHHKPVKAGSYFQVLDLKREVSRNGFDDVLLSIGDMITEASTSTVILEKNGFFIIPMHATNLESVTLKQFVNYLTLKNIPYEERVVTKNELSHCDHLYLLNSINFISGVRQVDLMLFKMNNNLINNFKNYLEELCRE